MKALVVKIRDAGVFNNPHAPKNFRNPKTTDKVMDAGVYKDNKRYHPRDEAPYIEVSAGRLGVKQVANLLRVLWGERPVPSLRKTYEQFKGDSSFESLAKRVFVHIETPVFPEDTAHKKAYYPEETTTFRKSVGDSWQSATRAYYLDGGYVQVKGGLLYPDRLRREIGEDLYNKFLSLVDSYGKVTSIQEGVELLNLHRSDNAVISFCEDCVNQKRTSFSNLILNKINKGITFHASPSRPLNLLMACSSIEIFEKLSATLYVPVTEDDLKKIEAFTGVATFLEGGFVTIEGVEDWSEILESGSFLTEEGILCT